MLENRLGIASASLGRHASHTLPQKIAAAADVGFDGLEVVYTDLEDHAKSISLPILDAAQNVRKICEQHRLSVISLAALENFEGSLLPLEERLKKAALWVNIARTLGAEFLQVPSTYLRDINNDRSTIVAELRQLSDLGRLSEPVIKIAYENLAWSSHCTLWQEALEIVNLVDRANFGLCLDTFHLTAKLWGNAFHESGQHPDGDETLEKSLRAFVSDCPTDKIFYVQLSDGERFDPPYSREHPWYNPDLEPGHVWSNEARPFPMETDCGAYMPVKRVTEAFLMEKGFQGWVSLETFDRRMRKQNNGPVKNAERGIRAWKRLKHALLSTRSRI